MTNKMSANHQKVTNEISANHQKVTNKLPQANRKLQIKYQQATRTITNHHQLMNRLPAIFFWKRLLLLWVSQKQKKITLADFFGFWFGHPLKLILRIIDFPYSRKGFVLSAENENLNSFWKNLYFKKTF